MNYINICLMIIYIYLVYKYYKSLKETQQKIDDSLIDYYELKNRIDKIEKTSDEKKSVLT